MNNINGNDINNIIDKFDKQELEKLYNFKSKDTRFKYIARGKEVIVYKLGNYAIKIMKTDDSSDNEIVAIKKIINHPEFINFIRFYFVKEIENYTIYCMNLAKDHLRNWYKNTHTDIEWLSMLIQILIGMYQFNILLKMFHNDLKRKNVLYDYHDKIQILNYNINGKIYQLKTKYIFYISDFSHASPENKHVANISDEYFIKHELFRKIFTDVISNELIDDKYSKQYIEDYIFKNTQKSEEYKKYYQEHEQKINNKFKNNKKMIEYVLKKTIISYGIEHDMIDITPFKNKISSPSKQIIDLFSKLDFNNLEECIYESFNLLKKL